MSGEPEPPPDDDAPPSLHRLDPDRGREDAARRGGGGAAPPPAFDPRPYRVLVGVIGLVVIVVVSVLQLVTHGPGGIGVAPGQRLHLFAAPLAISTLHGDPNPHPVCTEARHDPRALNVCLLAARGPVALAFFVTSARPCLRQVSALQSLAGRYPRVAFAAVAIGAGQKATAAIVRAHRWTIPVAYDRPGTVQQLYGVVACPFIELAARGGIVRRRLIGNRWQTAAVLDPYLRTLAAGA